MNNLQQSYGGDRSESLAQLLGLHYQPQDAMSAMDQQMFQTGMTSSTALKSKAMELDSLAGRDFQQRQQQIYEERRKALQSQIMLRHMMEGRRMATLGYFDQIAGALDERDPYQAGEKQKVLSGRNFLENLLSGGAEQQAGAWEALGAQGATSPQTYAGMQQLTDRGEKYQKAETAVKEQKAETEKKKAASDEQHKKLLEEDTAIAFE
jgi:hypothetical protein